MDPNTVSSSVSITVGQSSRELTRAWQRGGKNHLECQAYDGWKEHHSQQLAGHHFEGLWACAHVYTCTFVLIFKQHLSSHYINVWSLYTEYVSSPRGSSLHSGHMDNPIPVMKKHTRPLNDSQGTRFLWTDVAANSIEERFLPQTATGGQTHARPSRHRQMSPDESKSAAVAGTQVPQEHFL